MYVCLECAGAIDSVRFESVRPTCPHCGSEVRREPDQSWIDVARVSNLAEAGFLTDELVGMGIHAQIYQLEEFSALTDRWHTAWLIRVPRDSAQEAARHIREHLAEDAAEPESSAMGFRFSADAGQMDPLFWRPVALVVLAGVASFLLGQRFSDQPAERPPMRGSLSSAVGAIGRPLVTEPAAGRPRHRLSLDRRREVFRLDTDRDGDGRYESRQMFQASGAAW